MSRINDRADKLRRKARTVAHYAIAFTGIQAMLSLAFLAWAIAGEERPIEPITGGMLIMAVVMLGVLSLAFWRVPKQQDDNTAYGDASTLGRKREDEL